MTRAQPPVSAWLFSLVVLIGAGCSSSDGKFESSLPVESSQTVESSLPMDTAYPPHIQCMVDQGLRVVGRLESYAGTSPGYELEGPDYLTFDEHQRIVEGCSALEPPAPELSEDQLTQVYETWKDQRQCLVDLGYSPDEPPSLEQFIDDWHSIGPWMPIDGSGYESWTFPEYLDAKQRCGLEFYSRDG